MWLIWLRLANRSNYLGSGDQIPPPRPLKRSNPIGLGLFNFLDAAGPRARLGGPTGTGIRLYALKALVSAYRFHQKIDEYSNLRGLPTGGRKDGVHGALTVYSARHRPFGKHSCEFPTQKVRLH